MKFVQRLIGTADIWPNVKKMNLVQIEDQLQWRLELPLLRSNQKSHSERIIETSTNMIVSVRSPSLVQKDFWGEFILHVQITHKIPPCIILYCNLPSTKTLRRVKKVASFLARSTRQFFEGQFRPFLRWRSDRHFVAIVMCKISRWRRSPTVSNHSEDAQVKLTYLFCRYIHVHTCYIIF